MKRFAQLFNALDQTNKTNEKVKALAHYFQEAPDQDKVWTIAILGGKRPRRPVNTNYLKEWAIEMAAMPMWLFEETYHIVGDLGETIAGIIPEQGTGQEKPLSKWMEMLITLREQEEKVKKETVTQAWAQLSRSERFVFNKIMGGGFRMGVSQKLMTRALSKATGIEEPKLAVSHRLMGEWLPQNTTFEKLVLSEDEDEQISRPYPFFLAYALENEPKELGDPAEWYADRKWDGIRGQLIFRKWELFVWSRGEELVTDKFPEYQELIPHIPDGTVIDGEILPFRDGQPLSFNVLQTRIGRKNVSKKHLQDAPVVVMAYDLLEWQGEDIREKPYAERRKLLELLAETIECDKFQLSPLVPFDDWEQLKKERERSREFLSEGLMLKHKDAVYQVGRKKSGWYKWKVDPLTVDAVLTYAMRGHGRRANLYTDYTFAVWDGDQLVTFAKAYSGLTDEEIRKVDRFVKQNTTDRFGPVRQVKPELVFEIAFEGIAKSKRHKSGIALRFPRIHRWRHDKPIEEANTLEDLVALVG